MGLRHVQLGLLMGLLVLLAEPAAADEPPVAPPAVVAALDGLYPAVEVCLLVPPLPAAGLLEADGDEVGYLERHWRLARWMERGMRTHLPIMLPSPLDPTEGLDDAALAKGGEQLQRVLRPMMALFRAWWEAFRPGGEGLPPEALGPLRAACAPGAILVVVEEGGRLFAAVHSLLTGSRMAEGPIGTAPESLEGGLPLTLVSSL